MNSSLLKNHSELYENINIFNTTWLLNNDNDISLFKRYNNNDINSSSLFYDESINEDNLFNNQFISIEKKDLLGNNDNNNLLSVIKNDIEEEKKIITHEQLNTINNFNDSGSGVNFSPISMLTTSNSNMINNIGVKKEEDFIFDTKKSNINSNNENIDDKSFKCDFLESISLGLDENEYLNLNNKNKKNKIDLNNPTSLFAAIINLMKEKGPIEIKTIISCLENKKDTFRKANGSRYKQEFSKLIRTTLNTPDIFYKIEENKDINNTNSNNSKGNKYYFIEDKSAYYLQKKRERDMEKMLSNLKKKNTVLIPINLKIKLDKVNIIIKKLEKKYKGNKKYINVMFCINMFKSLIDKYLFLVKMDKVNSLYELSVLNDKIIDICHTLEKIEKGELFFTINDNIINEKKNEYNNQNSKNINFVDGDNNYFNEPPNKI